MLMLAESSRDLAWPIYPPGLVLPRPAAAFCCRRAPQLVSGGFILYQTVLRRLTD